jgi:hypothetical protein
MSDTEQRIRRVRFLKTWWDTTVPGRIRDYEPKPDGQDEPLPARLAEIAVMDGFAVYTDEAGQDDDRPD